MSLILTLMAAPGDAEALSAASGRIVTALEAQGMEVAPPVPLSVDAHDLQLTGQNVQLVKTITKDQVNDLPVDFTLQRPAIRAKKLLLSDMDSTMIMEECLDEIAEAAGVGDQVKPITARAMAGELDFEAALRERVALLSGKPWRLVDEALQTVRYSPGAETAVKTLADHGIHTVLISGGFTAFTDPISQHLGFHTHESNQLGRSGDSLSGTVEGTLVTKDRKRALLLEKITELGIAIEETMAIGDGANDIPMLEASGNGIGWRPKPAVADAVDTVIRHADMRALCYMLGIPASQHVC